MFKVKSLALTAALFGLTSAQTGCYPAYNSGTYGVDDYVSATRTVIQNQGQFQQCVPNVNGCPASGQQSIETTTVTTYNFKCLVAAWCSQPAYDPVGAYFNSNGAWENLGVCSVSSGLFVEVAKVEAGIEAAAPPFALSCLFICFPLAH